MRSTLRVVRRPPRRFRKSGRPDAARGDASGSTCAAVATLDAGIDASCIIARIASAAASVERHEPLLAALAAHAHDPARQVDVLEIEIDELAQPQSRRVEQLEDRAIAPPGDGRRVRRREQPLHLVDGQVRGQRLLLARRADERGRIVGEQLLAHEVARERAQRRQPARARRAAVAAIVQRRQESRARRRCRRRRRGPRSACTPVAPAMRSRNCVRSVS